MANQEKYNGMTLQEIEKNLPANMIPQHKEDYLNNCKYVIENESKKLSLDYCQLVRNTNFNTILFYSHLTA